MLGITPARFVRLDIGIYTLVEGNRTSSFDSSIGLLGFGVVNWVNAGVKKFPASSSLLPSIL